MELRVEGLEPPTKDTSTIAICEQEVLGHRYETGDRIGGYEIDKEIDMMIL